LEGNSINELLKQFEALAEQEKIEFMKAIMPQMCKLFQDNQQDMMSMCGEMMKNCGMDMSQMMGIMRGVDK
jgi:hypothetical protein